MGRLDTVGIEKIRIYPTQLKFDLSLLAQQRNYDVDHMHRELMVYERGINPTWEDSVTMAVNAAKPMLSQEDIDSIGLLIVGTETSLDQEKSLSSWVHRHLKLPSHCRHFEIKGACYSGTAAFRMATSWLMATAKPKQKALVITSDQSLHALNKPWEYVGGAAAVAMLVSSQPDFMTLENDKFGVYAQEVSDVIRPLPWIETGNSEDSLFSYIESLNGAYENYLENIGDISFREYFDYNVYHLPFAGISYRAHKQLLQYENFCSKKEIQQNFSEKTQPSIRYTQKIGSAYGGSAFIALFSLMRHAAELKENQRIGVFSYGSGACAEYYSCLVGKHAREITEKARLDEILEQRWAISFEEYEALENERVEMSKNPDFQPNFDIVSEVFSKRYSGKGLLVYKGSKGYYRHYEFS